jgi:hypothetical protein
MPVINSKMSSEDRLMRSLIKNIKPILLNDYQLIAFFDLYLQALIMQNIITNYNCFIKKDFVELELAIGFTTNRRLVAIIDRNNASYKLKG